MLRSKEYMEGHNKACYRDKRRQPLADSGALPKNAKCPGFVIIDPLQASFEVRAGANEKQNYSEQAAQVENCAHIDFTKPAAAGLRRLPGGRSAAQRRSAAVQETKMPQRDST